MGEAHKKNRCEWHQSQATPFVSTSFCILALSYKSNQHHLLGSLQQLAQCIHALEVTTAEEFTLQACVVQVFTCENDSMCVGVTLGMIESSTQVHVDLHERTETNMPVQSNRNKGGSTILFRKISAP
jgi:hypothetical protein